MAAPDALRIFIVAGEESGDRLGAALMTALTMRAEGRPIVFAGVGGEHMERQRLRSLFPLTETAFMGFSAIPGRFFSMLARIREAADAAVAARPDVLVIIDSPEFTHRVARRVRRFAPHIRIVDYVSPSVWAWRPGRAPAMRHYIDRVLALLPFEPAAMEKLGGPACSYVGHPLSEQIADLRPNRQEDDRRNAEPPVLLVMPGSRRGEVDHMLDIFGQAVERAAARLGTLEVVIPTLPTLAPVVREKVAQWRLKARVVDDVAGKNAAFRIARAALVKSGTGTLELALAGIPMVAAYRVGAVEAFVIKRMIRSPSVILANLVLGENIVPEFLQGDATPQKLAEALIPLVGKTPAHAAQIEAFRRLDGIMEVGRLVPSDRAAQIVLDLANRL